MGASEGAKFVIVCAEPSSVRRKFSFFQPVRKFPLLSVTTTSTGTTGTVTEMENPGASDGGGGCCWSFCLDWSFDCAQACISTAGIISVNISVPKTNPRKNLVRMD